MLELRDLARRYGDVVALDGVSFTVEAGQMFGFVGPSGAGKTTTMRIILGVLAADRGQVRFRGTPVDFAMRTRFGYMPDERGLYPKMRVRDQLVYLARLHGRDVAAARASADGWIERLSLILILYGQLLTYGYWVSAGVVEEKASRVVEVVLSTIRPAHLLAGKVIGIGLLGLANLLLTVGIGLGVAQVAGALEVDGDIVGAAALALAWFVVGYAFYACAFACAGALVPRQEELQSSMTPLTLTILVAFFVAFAVLNDPDGTLAHVSAFIPMTAPITMPPRIVTGDAPAWEIAASLAVTIGASVALIPLAARIYSGGVLRTGSALKLREAWRAARS